MTKDNPRAISLKIAVYVLAFFLLSDLVHYVFLSNDTLYWIFLVISSLLVFGIVYFMVNQTVEKFIYQKIRVLYKNIHNLKTPKQKVLTNSKWLETAEQEVEKWAEEQKNEMENLKNQETYRRDFLGNVSHELKTPIFNIQGYVLTLLDGGLEDETINKEYLLRAEKSINRMIAIVTDLDILSKLESDVQNLEFEKFDIVALTTEIVELYEIQAQEKNIAITINYNHLTPIMVNADKEKIRHVLSNLIENSIKYGNPNGRTKLSYYDMDEQMLIEVADTGIGIAPQDISRIFERFYRTNHGRATINSGSGLGLAIVKHIIEAHHQTINVRSTLGVGTTFGFTLQKA